MHTPSPSRRLAGRTPHLNALLSALGLLTLACAGRGGKAADPPDYVIPALEDLGSSDDALGQVDRTAALEGALAPDLASIGAPFDFATAPQGFRLAVDSAGAETIDDDVDGGDTANEAPAGPSYTYNNVVHGAAMVLVADAATSYVVGVPAAAIAVTMDGESEEIAPNVWAATNTVVYGGGSVTGLFVVAWVEVGWIAQLRLWTSDGRLNNTLWLDGFVSADRQFGWWDMYDEAGSAVGALEWLGDGAGNGEFGIAAFQGDSAGDVLGYSFLDGDAAVGFHDQSLGYDYWVNVHPDNSGSLQDPQYAGGVESCWDTEKMDAACE